MRENMFKVIVERPRRGNWRLGTYARDRLSGEEDLPTKIGVKRHLAVTRRRTKNLNENLRPLERFIEKQVGRPWDKVYAEISANLDPGHTVKEHVRSHIDDFVARRVTIGRDGEWMSAGRRYFGSRTAPWYQRFYVDPHDGILKDSAKLWRKLKIVPKPWRRKRVKGDEDVRRLDVDRELRRIDGIWFEVRYASDPDAEPDRMVYDLIKREKVHARRRHAAAKRQLSRDELRHHGFANASDRLE